MHRDTRGQAELIGVILLTGVVVVLTVTVGSVLFAEASSNAAADTVVDVRGNATTQYVTVTHAGGNSFDVTELSVVVQGDDAERYPLESFTQIQGCDAGEFEPGDRWRRLHSINGDEMDILLVHEESGRVLDSVTVDITVTIGARFETAPRYPGEGETITFDASRSTVAGSTLEYYVWDFGDGTTVNTTNETVDHAYASDGTYSVRLTVKATDGRVANRTRSVRVYNAAPTPSFTYSPTSPEGSETISFNSTSSDPDGSISTYEWSFGDGTTASGANVAHSYSSPGNYTVALTVTDDDGASRSANRPITVADPSPHVTNIDVEGAPVNHSEAGAVERNVTIRYDQPMNRSIAPSVSIAVANTSGTPTGSRWLNDTAYLQKVDIEQNSQDVTAMVSVTSAEDTDGNVQQKATKDFLVDTQSPGTPNDIVGIPNINASNQTAVTYDIQNPSTVYGDEDIEVTLTDPSGVSVTNRTPIQGGGGDVTSVTMDASSLSDGGINVSAVAIDDVNNTGGITGPDQLTKDAQAPTIRDYAVVSNADKQLTVAFNATEVTTSIADVSIAVGGPGVVDGIVDANNNTSGNTTHYEITYSVTENGRYDVKLIRVLDTLGNNGSSGQTETLTTGVSPEITGATLDSTNSYVDITFSEGVYANGDGTGGVSASDFDLAFRQHSGDVTDVSIRSVETTGGGAPSGGETTLRFQLNVTNGPASGVETIEIRPADGSSIYDADGSPMASTETTGNITLSDRKAPAVTVNAPDGGEQVAGGSTVDIEWSATSETGDVDFRSIDIAYSTDNGTTFTTVKTDTYNDGVWTWTVPNVDSSTVLVRVQAEDDAGNVGTDTSNATFTIDSTPPSVTVSQPNGGEMWVGGSTHDIGWSASDGLTGVSTVNISYSTDGGATYTTIVNGTGNDGTYAWTVPTVDSSSVLVRVTARDGAGNEAPDDSDATFTVDSSPPSLDTFTNLSASKNTDTVTIGSLSVSDSASGLTAVDVVVRDSGGTVIGSNNATGLGGVSSFSRSDYQVSTTGIQPNEQYTVTVRATDIVGKEGSVSETTTASGTVADANGPYTVDENGSVTLDGSGSSPNNPKSYDWTITSSPGGDSITEDTSTPNATYNAPPNVDSDTDVTVELAVEDGGTTYTDTTTVTVRNVSQNAGTAPSVDSLTVSDTNSGEIVADWSVSDPDGDINSVTVDFISRDSADEETQNGTPPSGTNTYKSQGKHKGETYDVTVTVVDSNGNSDTRTESITL